jgi:hypothetical protein
MELALRDRDLWEAEISDDWPVAVSREAVRAYTVEGNHRHSQSLVLQYELSEISKAARRARASDEDMLKSYHRAKALRAADRRILFVGFASAIVFFGIAMSELIAGRWFLIVPALALSMLSVVVSGSIRGR